MTLEELRDRWRSEAETYARDGALVDGARLLTRCAEQLEAAVPIGVHREGTPAPAAAAADWRERIWTCADDVRLGVRELAEAVGKSKAWVYRHTSQKSGYGIIPHRKLDGELLFRAGDVRRWLEAYERGERVAPDAEASGSESPRVLALGHISNGRKR